MADNKSGEPDWTRAPLPPKVMEFLRTLDEDNLEAIDWVLKLPEEDRKFLASFIRAATGAGTFGQIILWMAGVPSAIFGAWSFLNVIVEIFGRKTGAR